MTHKRKTYFRSASTFSSFSLSLGSFKKSQDLLIKKCEKTK